MDSILPTALKGAALIAFICITNAAHAQQKPLLPGNYPSKPIRVIIGAAPGGNANFNTQLVMGKLGERWNTPVVIDNRSGALGIIGTDLVAKAVPDGYTLLSSFTSSIVTLSLLTKVPYDVQKDLAPISKFSSAPFVLAIPGSLPVNSVKELIAYAQSKPGALNFGSTGIGSTAHLAAELFMAKTGTKMVHVPYKGGGPGLIALVGGEVQMFFSGASSVMAHAKSGQLKVLGVGSLKRSPQLPDLPTIAESGVPGYEVTGWYGLFAPARTNPAIILALNREITQVLNLPAIQERFTANGADIAPGSPKEFKDGIASELETMGTLIKGLNIKM